MGVAKMTGLLDEDYEKHLLALRDKVLRGEEVYLDDLELSVRSTNGLRNAGYFTVNSLFGDDGIMGRLKHTPNIGRRSIGEITDVLTTLGVDTQVPKPTISVEHLTLAELKARITAIRTQRNMLLSELLVLKTYIDLKERASVTETQRTLLARKYPDVAPFALAGLSEREIVVLCNRPQMTQKQIGDILGVTPSRAREIEMKAYRKLSRSIVPGIEECVHSLGLCQKSGLCIHEADI